MALRPRKWTAGGEPMPAFPIGPYHRHPKRRGAMQSKRTRTLTALDLYRPTVWGIILLE